MQLPVIACYSENASFPNSVLAFDLSQQFLFAFLHAQTAICKPSSCFLLSSNMGML